MKGIIDSEFILKLDSAILDAERMLRDALWTTEQIREKWPRTEMFA